MQYSVLSALSLASVVAAKSTITAVDTVTQHHTTDVTITSCSHDACSTTVQAHTQTVVTKTVNGVATEYTTICPVSEEEKKTVAPAATSPKEEIVTATVTQTVNGEETVYTTVCPASEVPEQKAPETAAPETAAPNTVAPGTAAPGTAAPGTAVPAAPETTAAAQESEDVTYVDITTTPTVLETTGVEATITSQETLTSVYNSGNSSSLAGVNTFEAKAAGHKAVLGAAGFAGLAAVLL